MLRKYFTASFCLFTTVLFSQQLPQEAKVSNIMSPETATLGKYGSYSVNKHTGTPSISVPLYNLTENGISIPISMQYDATGFIPNKSSGTVGLNWNLLAGGAITRIVKGQPDEKNNTNGSGVLDDDGINHTYLGYIRGLKDKQHYSKEQIRTLEKIVTPPGFTTWPKNYKPISQLEYEYEPDIFTFNFLGHSGKFFVDNEGLPRVQSDKRYKIDLTDFSRDDFNGDYDLISYLSAYSGSLNDLILSRIVITSDDGYKFYFGGSLNALEIGFPYSSKDVRNINGKAAVINSWHLTKVESPDGNKITFNYQTYTNFQWQVILWMASTVAANHVYNYEANFLDIRLYRNESVYLQANVSSPNTNLIDGGGVGPVAINKQLTKLVYLESISSENQTVSFLYGNKDIDKPDYKQSDVTDYINKNLNYRTRRLEKIIIKENAGSSPTIDIPWGAGVVHANKAFEFQYSYEGATTHGYRMFLNEIVTKVPGYQTTINSESGENSFYSFSYYNKNVSVDPLTKGLDIWGYYNGADNNPNLIGDSPNNPGGEYELNYSTGFVIRTAFSGSTSDINSVFKSGIGLLNKITYPTGGYTEFNFENHSYNKVVKRTIANGNIPTVITENGIAGGARIKEIKSTPGTSTKYYYLTDYADAQNTSSGILRDYGRYYLYLSTDYESPHFSGCIGTITWGKTMRSLSSDNITLSSTYNENHIEYSEVQEVSGEGYINSTYSTYITNPDTYDLGNDSYKMNAPNEFANNFDAQVKRLFQHSTRDIERGKIIKEEIFKVLSTAPIRSYKLISSSDYKYNEDVNRVLSNTIGYKRTYSFALTAEEYYGGCSYTNNSKPWRWHGLYQSYALYYYHNNVTKKTEKLWDETSNNYITKETKYSYFSNDNPKLTKIESLQSDGTYNVSEYKYAEEMPSNTVQIAMVNKFMVGIPIEESTKNGSTLLKTSTNHYFLSPTSLPDPNNPLSYLNLIKLQYVDVKNNLYPASTTNPYETLRFNKYDDNGKPIEAINGNSYKVSYKWDYKNTSVVAVINNSTENNVFYNSFETSKTDGWSYSTAAVIDYPLTIMGTKVFALKKNGVSYSIDKAISPSISCVLSFWFKGTSVTVAGIGPSKQFTRNGWQYKEYILSPNSVINISGDGLLDELRLYPVGSQMTTYAYNPLYGMISQSDANNQVRYYEYDGFGRLSLVRDIDKNILTKYCYNLYGQPENCLLSSAADWKSTGKTRCLPCAANPNYSTSQSQEEKIDHNPQSPTYNTSTWVNISGGSCVAQADWQQISWDCHKVNGVNTGYKVITKKDMNPCSPTFNNIQTETTTVQSDDCQVPPPPTCNSTNCNGEYQKCVTVGGVATCETAQLRYTSFYRVKEDGIWVWYCNYVFCWSDGTYLPGGTDASSTACQITLCQ